MLAIKKTARRCQQRISFHVVKKIVKYSSFNSKNVFFSWYNKVEYQQDKYVKNSYSPYTHYTMNTHLTLKSVQYNNITFSIFCWTEDEEFQIDVFFSRFFFFFFWFLTFVIFDLFILKPSSTCRFQEMWFVPGLLSNAHPPSC